MVSHDAFGYLAKYGLDVHGIVGLSPDAEPTPAAISELEGLIRTEGITTVYGETLASLHHQILNERPGTNVLAEPLRGLVDAALSRVPEERPRAQDVLDGLLSGVSGDALEAGTKAAGLGEPPSVTLPPALGDVAEQVYRGLGWEAQQAVPRVLLRMVAAPADAQGALRPVPVGDLVDGVTGERALQDHQPRLMLHATRIALPHPGTGQLLSLHSAVPF